MQAEQYVYGRVSKGLSGSGGYQTAAVSADLKDKNAVLENLQALSFYPSVGRQKTNRPRYAFAIAGQNRLSFSRTAFAKDRSGSVGYFAHHLVFPKDEVFQNGCLPVYLLRTYPFFKNEYDLPDNRVLDPIEIEPKIYESDDFRPSDCESIFKIADELIKADKIYIPAVITEDLDDQAIIEMAERILACFPLSLALKLPFCTNFTTTADNLACYRFVTASDVKSLPEPKEVFIHLDAATAEPIHIVSPYTQWLRKKMPPPARIQDYFIRCEGYGQYTSEERLKTVNSSDMATQALPSLLESQWPGWNRAYLENHPALFAAYYKRVAAWDISRERDFFERDPVRAADAALQFRDTKIQATLLEWISEAIAEQNSQAPEMLAWVRQNHLIRELAVIGRRLPTEKAIRLAEALSGEDDYDDSLHQFVAQYVFEQFPSFYENEDTLDRILSPANIQRGGVSAQIVAILTELQRQQTFSDEFDWERISSENYRTFTNNLIFLFKKGVNLKDETLLKLIDSRCTESAFEIIKAAISRKNLADMIVLAEEELELTTQQKDTLIDRIEQTKNRQAAAVWLDAENAKLNENQRERLEAILESGYKGFFKKIAGAFIGATSQKGK